MQLQYLTIVSWPMVSLLTVLLASCGAEGKYSDERTLPVSTTDGSSSDATNGSSADSHSSHQSDEECMALHECHINGEDDEEDFSSNDEENSPSPGSTDSPDQPQPTGNPNIVTFSIAQGTGGASWNSQGNAVRAKVGQTLRIVNNDSSIHRLHTNGAPCAHGSPIAPGGTFDCVLSRTFNPEAAAGPLYDHGAGTSAEFWVYVTN